MELREIRLRVLGEHQKLRAMLDELDQLNKRFDEREDVGAELCEAGAELFEAFAAHLRLEDSLLVSALEGLPHGGPELARRLEREHSEQRATLVALLRRLGMEGRDAALVSAELRGFADSLRADMHHEEKTVLSPDFLREAR